MNTLLNNIMNTAENFYSEEISVEIRLLKDMPINLESTFKRIKNSTQLNRNPMFIEMILY